MNVRSLLIYLLLLIPAPVLSQTDKPSREDMILGMQGGAVRAQLVPLRKAVFSAGISAIVEQLPVQEGDLVRKGDLLLRFDCDRIEAAMATAQARVVSAEATLEVNRELLKLNSVGPLEVRLNEAELDVVRGEVDSVRSMIKHCEIRAPFAGAVTLRAVESSEYVEEGETVLELISRDDLEVRMLMPSHALSWLKVDTGFNMTIEELGLSLPGKITRLGGAVDPVSLTVPAFGVLEKRADSLLPGMSGQVYFTAPGNP